MPLSVFVRNSGATGEDCVLTFDGDRIVFGRGVGADVRLPDPSVSARHAVVRATGGQYALVDEASTNGTFVGGVRLVPHTPRTLRSGDLVRVGRVWLEVRMDAAPPTPDLAMATREVAFALVAHAMEAVGDDFTTRLEVVEGTEVGETLSLTEDGHVYIIGRGPDCDLRLADADASREHVQVVRRGGSVLIRDLGAKNRAAIGDAWVPTDRDAVWRNRAGLRVGRTVIALIEPVADALAELEAAMDEVLPEGAPPAPPVSSSREEPVPSLPGAPDTTGPIATAPLSRGQASTPSRWSSADVAVAAAAFAILALSGAGLFWLLHG